MESVNPVLPEDPKLQKLFQAYLQKCCEVGQIEHQLEKLESQKKEIEKNLEITRRQRNKVAQEHGELQKSKFQKLKPAEETELELKEVAK